MIFPQTPTAYPQTIHDTPMCHDTVFENHCTNQFKQLVFPSTKKAEAILSLPCPFIRSTLKISPSDGKDLPFEIL